MASVKKRVKTSPTKQAVLKEISYFENKIIRLEGQLQNDSCYKSGGLMKRLLNLNGLQKDLDGYRRYLENFLN